MLINHKKSCTIYNRFHSILRKAAFLLSIFGLLLLIIACGTDRSPDSAREAVSKKAPEKALSRYQKEDRNDDDSLQPLLRSTLSFPDERLLEYRVNLEFESDNIGLSRKSLMQLANTFGFLKKCDTDISEKRPELKALLHVQSSNLYQALGAVSSLGELVSEEVKVIDHTAAMFASKLRKKRAQQRQQRRGQALDRTAPAAKSWKDKEEMLSQSENRLDQETQKQWSLKDRVRWAKINISIHGPEGVEAISVPSYERALKGALEVILYIGYVLLWLLPVALLIWLLIRYQDAINRFFQKKGDKKKK